jgi:hypothetical protein
LTIPEGSKKAILWVYKYMQAGEHDPVGMDTFQSLDSGTLTVIYRHCDFLEYEPLKKRIYGRLKGKFYQSLPTVDEIQLYQTSIPGLYDYAIHRLSGEMANPRTCSYDSYLQLAKTNEAFGKALDDSINKVIATRVKVSEEYYRTTKNRHVIWAIDYVESVRAGRKPYTKSNNMSSWKPQQKGNVAPGLFGNVKASANGVPGNTLALANKHDQKQTSKVNEPFTCYKCDGEGHLARNCTTETAGESVIATGVINKRPPPVCYTCNATGHIARNCTQEKPAAAENSEDPSNPHRKPKSKEPFVCYNCGEEGHMARECRN